MIAVKIVNGESLIMLVNPELYDYLSKLQNYIEAQNGEINNLKKEVGNLQKEVKEIKNRPFNIEKIEYKFDQLKVETLEGTLNIGITPNLKEAIEDFSVNESSNQEKNIESEYYRTQQQITQELEDFLENEGQQLIENLAEKNNYQIPESFKKVIIDDIKKQLEQKIQYYLNQITADDKKNTEEGKDAIAAKIKNEISNAINKFIQNSPGKENNA